MTCFTSAPCCVDTAVWNLLHINMDIASVRSPSGLWSSVCWADVTISFGAFHVTFILQPWRSQLVTHAWSLYLRTECNETEWPSLANTHFSYPRDYYHIWRLPDIHKPCVLTLWCLLQANSARAADALHYPFELDDMMLLLITLTLLVELAEWLEHIQCGNSPSRCNPG